MGTDRPERYLSATEIINSDHSEICAFAKEALRGCRDSTDKAIRLYYTVRDMIWYDPYYPFFLPEHYRASNILKARRGFCIPKVSLLCALGRASGIPCRAGFATVRNHLATRQLLDFMGTDIFSYHGYIEFYLEGRWVKATPAFNKELCERHGVAPLEFNGRDDSMFQAYSAENRKFMEYLAFHGTHADIPVVEIISAWEKTYGLERVRGWIQSFEKYGDVRRGRFDTEDVI